MRKGRSKMRIESGRIAALEGTRRARADRGVRADEERLASADRGVQSLDHRGIRGAGREKEAEPRDALVAPPAAVLGKIDEDLAALVAVLTVNTGDREGMGAGVRDESERAPGRERETPGERLGYEDRASCELPPGLRRVA